MNHICQIYVLLNTEGVEDYVGRSKNLVRRLYEHRAELGFRPNFYVVDSCSENCRNVERFWISFYKALGYKLRNVCSGQGPHYLPDSLKEHLSEVNRRPVTWGDKISTAQKNIPKNWSTLGLEKQKLSRFKPGVSFYSTLTEEQKERHRLAAKKSWQNPELRVKMLSGIKKG